MSLFEKKRDRRIEEVAALAADEEVAEAELAKRRERDLHPVHSGFGLDPFARPALREEILRSDRLSGIPFAPDREREDHSPERLSSPELEHGSVGEGELGGVLLDDERARSERVLEQARREASVVGAAEERLLLLGGRERRSRERPIARGRFRVALVREKPRGGE
jgi:hypothetical protein